MAATIPTVEPDQVTVGDTVKWTKTFADYPSSGWTLTYTFLRDGGGTPITIVATTVADGSYSVAVTAATTTSWAKGSYTGQAKVAHAGEVYTVWQGRLEILPSTATAADNRPWFKIALENVTAVIQGTAAKEIQEMEIEGQRLIKRTPRELWELHDRLKAMTAVYDQNFQSALGRGNPRVKVSRFVAPQ